MSRIVHRSLLVAGIVGAAVAGTVSPALAQSPAQPAQPAEPPAQGGAAAKPADAVERARIHYERGLQLFNEENYDAALFEFDRAYELAPSYKILYNMGRIQRQQNNYAAALRSYSRYLREGGDQIPPDRRAEVDREMKVLKPRVAEITVKVNVDDAEVFSDDIPVCTATVESSCVGRSPLQAPLIVNPGRHKITATKRGYVAANSVVTVVGSDKIEVNLDLVSLDRPVAHSNPWTIPTIIGWSATGVAGIATIITGVMASNAKDDQEAKLTQVGTTRADLDDARDKTQTLAGVTDALLITTAVFAGASAYLTIRMIGDKNSHPTQEGTPPPQAKRGMDLRVGPTGLAAVGTF